MRVVTVLQNAAALLVITMALVNGQNFPNMMGNPFMPQSPIGQNRFNQPNGPLPQNMFPAGPQPPGDMSNPLGSNLPGSQGPAQNPFGSNFPGLQGPAQNPFSNLPGMQGPAQNPFSNLPGQQGPAQNPFSNMPGLQGPAQNPFSNLPGQQGPAQNPFGSNLPGLQGPAQNPFGSNLPGSQGPAQNSFGPTFPQPPALSPSPQNFNSESPNLQNNPVSNPQGPSNSQVPVSNLQGPPPSQDPVAKPPVSEDLNSGSSAPQSRSAPPESSTSNQQNPEPSSSGGSNSAPSQPQHDVKRKLGPRRVGFRTAHRPSHTRYRPSTQHSNQQQGDPLRGHRIVCIFNNRHSSRRGFTPANIDPTLCTHLNYEFAILDPKTYEMITGDPELDIEENFFQQAIDLKKRNQKLKVMLALGGWNDSTKKYSELAADPDKRKNFIEKAIGYLKAHEFDGMDFAWEYPNCWQGAIHVEPKDKKNFVTLLEEMKPEFQKNGLLLSVSVGAIKREIEAAYDVPAIAKIVDFISVMTYDMHGPWEKVTGHHTQFETVPGDEDPDLNVKGGMQVWIDMGAPKHKLNMGLAFYGKSFRLADPDNNGIGAPAVGIGNAGPVSGEGGFLLYNEICQFLNSGNWTEKEEKNVGFYAHSIVDGRDQWACYDPPMMMVRKAKFVVESGLGGVLLKDLSGDDYKGTCFSMPFPLLKMVRLEMIQRIRKLLG